MEATPNKSGRTAPPGSRFLSDVLADNLRVRRTMDRLSQSDLASRMKYLGHDWTRATVSDVERAARNVTVDELLALSMSLGVPVPALLDPTGVDGRCTEAVFYGRDWPIPVRSARHWIRGEVTFALMARGAGVIEGSFTVHQVDDEAAAFKEATEGMREMSHASLIDRVRERDQQKRKSTKKGTR